MTEEDYSWFKKWSNSSITTLQICGHKFYLRHLKKDRRPSGFAAKRGIATHKAATEAHKRQMVEAKLWTGASRVLMEEMPGTPRSIEEARDLAASEFEAVLQKDGVALTDKDLELGEAVAKARAKDAAVDLAGLYVGEVAPHVSPVAVERKVEIKPKNSDIVLTGYIDLISTEEGEVIRDLKTKDKKPFEKEAELSQQLTLYHLIRLADVGKLPVAGKLVHVIRTPERHEMSVVVQETKRTVEDIKLLVRRINAAVEAVRKGVFVPADQAAPASPCGYCEYADGTCIYVRRRGK